MSDYVTKLRGAATVAEIDGDPFCRFKPEFVRKVADEIERLRARVAELEAENAGLATDVHDLSPSDGMTDEEIEQAAKKAGGEHE